MNELGDLSTLVLSITLIILKCRTFHQNHYTIELFNKKFWNKHMHSISDSLWTSLFD
jgi:hypothetical protein